jgi:hypothetical protein
MTRRRKSLEVSGGECILPTVSWNENVAMSVICQWFMLDVVQLVRVTNQEGGVISWQGHRQRYVTRHRMIVFFV